MNRPCPLPPNLLPKAFLAFVTLWLPAAAAVAQIPAPQFEQASPITSQDGHAQLNWAEPGDRDLLWQFELQYAGSGDFADPIELYRGPDLARYLSGMPNGSRFYRIRAIHPETQETSPWSDTVEVKVEHQSLTLALSLAGLGAIVMLLTAGVVIVGSLREK